jgi:hypothetical protein
LGFLWLDIAFSVLVAGTVEEVRWCNGSRAGETAAAAPSLDDALITDGVITAAPHF